MGTNPRKKVRLVKRKKIENSDLDLPIGKNDSKRKSIEDTRRRRPLSETFENSFNYTSHHLIFVFWFFEKVPTNETSALFKLQIRDEYLYIYLCMVNCIRIYRVQWNFFRRSNYKRWAKKTTRRHRSCTTCKSCSSLASIRD